MNLTSIQLYSNLDYNGTPYKHAELYLDQISNTQSYIIKSVSGLDNADIVPQFYGTGNGILLGYQYYAMKPPPRVVSMLIRLNPQYRNDETVQSLRDNFYKMISFTRRGEIELRFMDSNNHWASLYGLITKFESSLFGPDPEIQITFKCSYPFLKAPTFTTVTPTVSGNTESTSTWSDNLSTSPHGFRMEISFTAAVTSNFTIQGISGTTVAPFTIQDYDFKADDRLYIYTEDQQKSVFVDRVVNGTSTRTYLADRLSAESIWPIMFPGTTSIDFSTTSFTWESLKYKALYWGV